LLLISVVRCDDDSAASDVSTESSGMPSHPIRGAVVASAVNARVIVARFELILGILMFATPFVGDGDCYQSPNTRRNRFGNGGRRATRDERAQSVARSMTASQWESVGRLSPGVTAAESEGDRPFSSRSVIVGFVDPEDTCVRAGAAGGQVVPLLNMVPTNRHEPGQR
jgi:hypothetical protein